MFAAKTGRIDLALESTKEYFYAKVKNPVVEQNQLPDNSWGYLERGIVNGVEWTSEYPDIRR